MPTCKTRNAQTGRFETRYVCQSCQLVRINGVVCHETGCPDAWRDETRECKECGSSFTPETRGQRCCDDNCARAYAGLPSLDDESETFFSSSYE